MFSIKVQVKQTIRYSLIYWEAAVPDSLPYIPAQEGRTLLDELNHRIKNELASIINLITFKAVWADNVEVKEALSDVVDLLHQHVAVHNILTTPDGDMLLDAGEQLRKLGLAMGRSTLDRMNIHLLLSAETLPLDRSDAGGFHWPSTSLLRT
jgi:two-component sensor histidine kinase